MEKSQMKPMGQTSYLATIQGKFWRWDLKAIVGGVLFGVLLTVLGAIFERADAAMTGGSFVVLGAINFYTISALSTLFFRQPGGLIAGEVNALISVATGASPMSPWFIPTNAAATIVFALVAWKLRMDKWWHHLICNTLAVCSSMLFILWGLVTTIKLPMNIALLSYVVTCVAGIVGATVLSIIIAKAVDKSRVLQ